MPRRRDSPEEQEPDPLHRITQRVQRKRALAEALRAAQERDDAAEVERLSREHDDLCAESRE